MRKEMMRTVLLSKPSFAWVSAWLVAIGIVFSGNAAPLLAQPPVLVVMHTTKGDIKLELNAEKAPISVENFVMYAKSGHYDGTIFHRVIRTFMIQGGGFDDQMKEKKTMPPIRNESSNGLTNDPYTIAMARTPKPNSATAQFFINTADNKDLNKARAADGFGYAVFGKVLEGKEVVDAIAAVPVATFDVHANVPTEPIVIESVEILEAEGGADPSKETPTEIKKADEPKKDGSSSNP